MSLIARVKELRTEKKTLAEQAGKLLTDAAAAKRGLTAEEQQTFDRIHVDIEAKGVEIGRLEKQLDVETELRSGGSVLAGRGDSDPGAGDPDAPADPEKVLEEERRSFRSWARGGVRALSDEQRQRVEKRNQAMPAEVRALSALSDSAGAYTIAEGMFPQLIEAQLSYVGMRQPGVATVLTTSTGAPLHFITDNDTSNTGEILAENTTASNQDVSFGRVSLGAYIFSSKLVLVPIALLQDSEFNLEAYLFKKFGERIGRITNTKFTTGSGANEPYGLLSQTTLGTTAALAAAFTWLELIDLKHSVDPAYRANSPKWMFNDTTLKAAKKLLDGQGRPLWQSGVALREPDTLDGDGYVINQAMASPATGTKPIAYGDLSHYHIRDVSGPIVLALRERYAEKMQVGFIAFSRHDGALVDAGTHPVKHLLMA